MPVKHEKRITTEPSKLNSFEVRCNRKILEIKWKQVTNEKIGKDNERENQF